MGKYRCKFCDWEFEVFYKDGDGIRTILDHDNTHIKDSKIETKTDKVPCDRCNGNGYTLEKYDISVDVSEAD